MLNCGSDTAKAIQETQDGSEKAQESERERESECLDVKHWVKKVKPRTGFISILNQSAKQTAQMARLTVYLQTNHFFLLSSYLIFNQ